MGCVERVRVDGKIITRDCHTGAAVRPPAPADGPGTELKAILKSWLGIEANLGCSCNAMAARMNSDPAWCTTPDGLATIVGAMRAEHQRRRRDGKTILPWSDFGAAQLVRLAVRRAGRKAAG
jgi:hypothetical protein